MFPQHPLSSRLRRFTSALWPMAMALGLTACADPRELIPGAIATAGKPPAPWQAQVSARSDASRRLSEGEGETVVATAIAAHEMRRP
jgi:hypothetical protein